MIPCYRELIVVNTRGKKKKNVDSVISSNDKVDTLHMRNLDFDPRSHVAILTLSSVYNVYTFCTKFTFPITTTFYSLISHCEFKLFQALSWYVIVNINVLDLFRLDQCFNFIGMNAIFERDGSYPG